MTGHEMRALQERHGYSDEEMAELLGYSVGGYRDIAKRSREVPKKAQAALDTLEVTDPAPPPGVFGESEEPVQGADDLPDPPYNPVDEPEEEEPAEKKTRSRRSSPRRKGLTVWQEETAQALVGVVCGSDESLEVNGSKVDFRIPGLCDLIARIDPFDANVIYGGTPGLSVALVKIAPKHPWLKGGLDMLVSGGEYRELTQAVLAIMVPIALHHGMLGGAMAGVTGSAAPVAEETAGTE